MQNFNFLSQNSEFFSPKFDFINSKFWLLFSKQEVTWVMSNFRLCPWTRTAQKIQRGSDKGINKHPQTGEIGFVCFWKSFWYKTSLFFLCFPQKKVKSISRRSRPCTPRGAPPSTPTFTADASCTWWWRTARPSWSRRPRCRWTRWRRGARKRTGSWRSGWALKVCVCRFIYCPSPAVWLLQQKKKPRWARLTSGSKSQTV